MSSNLRFGRTGWPSRTVQLGRLVLAVGFAILVIGALAGSAFAASPVADGRVLLAFGQAYGSGSVHRGLDIAASPGAEVRASSSGVVSFVGAVPADGGGTAVAVTIEVADGTKVSVMPLASASVKRGAAVVMGETVGEVAEAGDASSPQPHVHLSLRRGSVYLDPAALLAAPGGGTNGQPVGEGAGTSENAFSPAAGASAPAGAAAGTAAGAWGAGHAAAAAVGAASAAPAASAGLASGVTLAPKAGPTPVPAGAAADAGVSGADAAARAAASGVAAASSGVVLAAAARPAAQPTVIKGLDVAGLLGRVEASAGAYARRHVRALAVGVGALLAGFAALAPLGSRASSGKSVCAVRPEGDAVAAAAGR